MLKQKFWVGLLVTLLCLDMPRPLFSAEESSNPEKVASASSAQSETPAPSAETQSEAKGTFTPYEGGEPPEGEKASPKGLDERVSLDLRNIEVTEALRFLAMKGGFNLAVSKSVTGRLMLLLNNVPIRDVLDIILLTNGLAYDKQGEIYNVMTEDEYKGRYGKKFSDARKTKIFKLKYAIPDQVFGMIDALKSDVGRVLVDQESGTALVVDTEQNLGRIQEAVVALEQKRTVNIFPLKYAKSKDIEEKLKEQIEAKKLGSVTSDERTNQVIVQTLPERMRAVAQMVSSLDKKTKEVLLVSKILKVTMTDDYHSEVKWEGFFKQLNLMGPKDTESFIGNHEINPLARTGTSFLDDFATIASTTRPTQGSKNVFTENLILGYRGEDTVESVVNFLRTIGETRVLSSPRLTVVNNQEAKIHVGEREAYVTSTTTTGQSTTTTAEAVTFVDVGIQLAVTPTINEDGFVTMKIKPEVSSVIRSLTTPSKNTIPIIDTSEAETTVMVKNGTTIIIAGLRKDENTNANKRVPFFGDIPVLGRAFQNVVTGKKRTELLVLITPHIIEGDRLLSGEPPPPNQGMKPYQGYSSFLVKSEQKPKGSSHLSSYFKKIFLLGRD